MDAMKISAIKKHLEGYVELPLSKSISNRALIISWLSGGKTSPGELSKADDTVLLHKLLRQIEVGKDRRLNAHNAGTVYRFLTAVLAITPGEWILDGDDRMCQRPIGPLVSALQDLGANIEYPGQEGFPPLRITGKNLEGGLVQIQADISSQFISALIMIGPALPRGLGIKMKGKKVSMPYLYLTMNMMKAAGAIIKPTPSLGVLPVPYKSGILPSATDWSAAAPWYSLMALAEGGTLLLKGLEEKSVQGDRTLPSYFIMFGVESEWHAGGVMLRKRKIVKKDVNFDLSATPDLAPSIIVTAAALGYKGHFKGLETLRIKESDRIEAVSSELEKNGFKCHIGPHSISFEPQALEIKHPIDTYSDHRIAMAFAPLAILGKPIVINNPGVVSKSYPQFWKELTNVFT
ncbi:MAG TPA: 3-phosphoshikimate 1-carboxyvinyltransferase [Bacteroidales bacterium]|nr:3-phosphoshikimate 1-carboxyvinyltransferase [Bacteroidales bacterium]